MMARLLGLAVLLGAGLAVYLLALTVATYLRLTRPPRRTYGWAVARGLPGDPSETTGRRFAFTAWTLDRAGVSMPVWDITGDDPRGPCLIVTHGWGSSRVDMLGRLPAAAGVASRVLLWDMPGHGEAGGVCRHGAREADDLAALVDACDGPVVLWGHSLGAEVSVHAALRRPGRVRGVVLESPFRRGVTPALNVLRLQGFPRLVNLPLAMAAIGVLSGAGPMARWRDLARAARGLAGGPGPERGSDAADAVRVLVLHGERDAVSPPDDGRAIAEAGGGAYALFPGVAHNDLWAGDAAEVAGERLASFVRTATAESRGPVSRGAEAGGPAPGRAVRG